VPASRPRGLAPAALRRVSYTYNLAGVPDLIALAALADGMESEELTSDTR
jgi:hypothetical protein